MGDKGKVYATFGSRLLASSNLYLQPLLPALWNQGLNPGSCSWLHTLTSQKETSTILLWQVGAEKVETLAD